MQKNNRENQKYKKTKESQKSLRENQTNKVFKGFRPTLGYGFVVFCCFLFSRRFLENPNKFRENQKYTRKQPKTQTTIGTTSKNKVFKGFRPTLGYGFVFCFFSEGLTKQTKKNIRENQNTKENQRKPNKPSGKPNKQVFNGFRPTLGYWFGFLFLLFSRKFSEHRKTRERKKEGILCSFVWVFAWFYISSRRGPVKGKLVWFFVFAVFPKVFRTPKNPRAKKGRHPMQFRVGFCMVLYKFQKGPGQGQIRWSGDPVIRWSGDPAIRRSGDPAIRRSGDPAIRRSGDPVIRWSGDLVIRRLDLIESNYLFDWISLNFIDFSWISLNLIQSNRISLNLVESKWIWLY